MTPESQDDDRTVIRPTASPHPASPPDDRTVIGAAASAPAPAAPGAPDMGNGLAVGTYLGEFEITSMLGEGGFGIVYLATDHSLQRRVALKEYMPSALAARSAQSQVQVKSERHRETFEAGRKSFVNEARLLAQFDHPSLVKVYRFWEANGTAYMVMPFYEGRTLKDTLRELGAPPDEAWLRTLLAPLTEALSVIHTEQCYHRDIAPDNVMMLAGSQRPLLLDFGAARRVIGDMTQALTVILKPGYAPVEQYAEIPGMKQGAWTDVYALAAVVYFAITGKTPPPSVGRLLNDTYVPLTQAAAGRYSEGFLAAIDRALAVRPEARTQSIDQLRAELGLAELADADVYTTRPLPPSAAVPARPQPAPAPAAARAAGPAAAPARKGGAMLGIGAGVVVLAGVAIGAYLWLSPASRPSEPAAPSTPAATAPTTAPPAVATTAATIPPNVPPAPVVAAAPAGFDVPAEFDRVVRAQSPGFDVRAQPAKSTLRIGHDELSFSVTSDREGFLYVLAYGSDGALTQLYPNTVVGALKVRKGQTMSLPQRPITFDTTEPPGPGELLVLVSNRQRDFSAMDPQTDGPFRTFPTGAQAARLAAAVTGRLPPLAGSAVCPSAGPCDDEFGAALVKVETVR
jgi:serine/threonine protein kinase